MEDLFGNIGMNDFEDEQIEISIDGSFEEEQKKPEEKTEDKSKVLEHENNEESTEDLIDLTEIGIEEVASEEDDESDKKIDPLEDEKEKKSPSSEDKADTDDKSESKSAEQPSLFNSFASILADEGVLLVSDEEAEKITDAKSFLEAIKTTVKKNEFSDLTEPQKKALEAFRAGVPAQEYIKSANDMEILDSIKKEDIEGENEQSLKLRKDLIIENMIRKGLTETKAEKYAQMHIDAGSDKEEAVDAHKSLVAMATIDINKRAEEKAEKERKAKERREAFQTELKKSVETVDIIPGMNLNPSIRQEVFKSMTTPVTTTKDGRSYDAVMTNWTKDTGYKMRVHALHVLTKGFTDFTSLYGGKEKSKSAIDRLDQLAAEGAIFTKGKTVKTENKNTNKVKSFIDSLPDPNKY